MAKCDFCGDKPVFHDGCPNQRKQAEPSEYDILTNQPENLSVGELNKIVRILRERNYQLRLQLQDKAETFPDKFIGFLESLESDDLRMETLDKVFEKTCFHCGTFYLVGNARRCICRRLPSACRVILVMGISDMENPESASILRSNIRAEAGAI